MSKASHKASAKASQKAPAKAFASQADLSEKKITFEQLSPHCWAYTAEGDPNSGVIIGDRFIMVRSLPAKAHWASLKSAVRKTCKVRWSVFRACSVAQTAFPA